MSQYPATIITDLDGVLIKHAGPHKWFEPLELLPSTLSELIFWQTQGCTIVIMTGRPERNRSHLELEFRRLGVPYHILVTGVTSGTRILVNDRKPYAPDRDTAVAINLERDKGIIAAEAGIDAYLR